MNRDTIGRRPLVAGAAAGAVAMFAGARSLAAQEGAGATTAHPLVGAWFVAVTYETEAPAALTNLATFTADGNLLVANAGQLPNVPPGAGLVFTEGHGAWEATGERTAQATSVYLTVNQSGGIASVNTARATIEVDASGDRYTGEASLSIAGPDEGDTVEMFATIDATRITVEPMGAAATPTA